MNRKTILLGAGASAAATEGAFPVMRNFFDHKKITKPEKGYTSLHRFLASFAGSEEIKFANMEEVITHIETSLNGYGRDWGTATTSQLENLETVRSQFKTYLRERLSVPEKYREQGPALYQRLLENFDEFTDSIITLNYDLLMDMTLESLPVNIAQKVREFPPGTNDPSKASIAYRSRSILSQQALSVPEQIAYPQSYSSLGFYLKLHGSLNWLTCPNKSCANHSAISYDNLDPKDSLIGAPCYRCGSAVDSVIVPPTMQKNLNTFPKLGLIWNLAFQKIRQSEELILIGVSLPESDYYLRWLLREATRTGQHKRIILVTQDENGESRKRVKEIFGRSGGEAHKLFFCAEVDHYLSDEIERLQ